MDMLRSHRRALDETSRWSFIVGAPRCGTTSLSRYLKDHPGVCFSRVKEPHFFSQNDLCQLDDEELNAVVRKRYLEGYFPEPGHSSLMAEASVTYLYTPERMKPILRLWPRAKFVISVRNPLELIPSLHQRLIHNGDETVRDLRRAWDLVPERRAGRSIPRRCADPRWLDYWEAGQLGKHVQKFVSLVGRERCFISIFDDFTADPASEYRRLLEFLELEDDGRTNYTTHRQSFDVRIAWLQRILKRPPRTLVSVLANDSYRERLNGAKPPKVVQETALSLRKRLLRWNRVPACKPQLDEQLRAEMGLMYRDDVALLSETVGRDLRHWVAS